MTFRIRTHAVAAFALSCLAGAIAATLCVSVMQAQDPGIEPVIDPRASTEDSRLVGPQYPVQAEIIARVLDDGRAEFCLRTGEGEFACPRARFINPDRERRDRWIPSSEISWRVPVDPDRVVYPPTLVQGVGELTAGCAPDFERMMEATWKVETTRARGSGFYIGNGRFVTAHHVIEDVPPFVALTHGDRVVAAQVLGSSLEHDVALLQVYDPSQVDDLPILDFHNPEPSDVGEPVFLVGYPSAGALTVATGVLTRVWEDEILTSSSSLGGNSGGPMFDSCGNVIGVLWAGSSSRNFSHSGESLSSVLAELGGRSGQPPIHVPEITLSDGLVIWHFGPQPPEGVDCVRIDGAWWVGLAGAGALDVSWGVDSRGSCTSGYVRVLGLEGRPQPRPTPASAPDHVYDEGPCPGEYGAIQQKVEAVLHESNEEFGEVTLGRLRQFEWCEIQATYRLEVSFPSPLNHTLFSADLMGTGGRVNRGFGSRPGRGYYSRGGFVTGFWQDFAASPGFEPTAFLVKVDQESYGVEIEAPTDPASNDDVKHVEQRARIVVRIDGESNEVVACLRVVGSDLSCTSDEQSPLNFETKGWHRLSAHEWLTSLELEDAPRNAHCSPTVELAEQAWQMTALGGDGSAVYVGSKQFITADRLFSDETPWGVVSQGTRALPVARVASNARNGLALVEVIGTDHASLPLTSIARFAASTEHADSTRPFLVAYPWGDSDRFAMTRLEVTSVTDRLLVHDGWGWDRAGAPIVDPCAGEVIGLSTGRSEALRAETAVAVLQEMRRHRVSVQVPSEGPQLHGSVALLAHPVYLSTEQPDFGGWICNVRPSARYDVVYAVYMVNTASPRIVSVVDGVRDYPSRCGWSGKIFIVEYRTNEEPSALCAERGAPRSPRSNLELSLSLSQGIELVQASSFVRDHCPALPMDASWPSTHIVKLRITGVLGIRDISVRIEDGVGKLHEPNSDGGDVDPDVWTWRFNLGDAEPVRLVVAPVGEESASLSPEATAVGQSQEQDCEEDDGQEGFGLISNKLIDTRLGVGRIRLVELGAPVLCPWPHSHAAFVQFREPVSKLTLLDAYLIGADGSVVRTTGPGSAYGTRNGAYVTYRSVYVVPDEFEPIAVELRVGPRRWIAILR